MAFGRRSKDRMSAVEHVLDGYELPSFPHVITDALGRLGNPDVAMGEVAGVLELDPGMSVKLLQLANSASFGLRNPVDSLHKAVTMLGRNQVESILISSATRASVPTPLSPIFDTARFWKTAASRAMVATSISAVVAPTRRSETFTAALLQDMALPILVDHIDGYDLLLKQWYDGDVTDLATAEQDEFGWDHAAVGAKMGAMWEFPEALLDAIALHHAGDDTEIVGVRLVAAWHEVNQEIGRSVLLAQATEIPQLQNLDCEALIDEALERVGEVAALFT